MYANSAIPIDLSQLHRGDIIQYENPNNPSDWSHVHTVVVVGTNPDGSFNIIERNYDLKGDIREVTEWRPTPHAGWIAQGYRFGDAP